MVKVRVAHECPEWDFLWIEPGDWTFECCICKCDSEDCVDVSS